MPEWKDIFALNNGLGGPGNDFEARVFAKIHKKKQQRKIGLGIATLTGVIMLLSLFQLFRPLPRRLPLAGSGNIKEEVPVSEDLFFSASDNHTRYSLEPVLYRKHPAFKVPDKGTLKVPGEGAAQEATLNQI